MIRNRTVLFVMMSAAILAAGSTAFAGGSANLAKTQSDYHQVCFYEEMSGRYTNGVVGEIGNGIRFLGMDGAEEEASASGPSFFLLGGASRNGSVFSTLLPYAGASGAQSVVIFMNRNKTWCGYMVAGTDIMDEYCGTWEFGQCPADDTSTLRWFER